MVIIDRVGGCIINTNNVMNIAKGDDELIRFNWEECMLVYKNKYERDKDFNKIINGMIMGREVLDLRG